MVEDKRQVGTKTEECSTKLIGECLDAGFLKIAQTFNYEFVKINKRWNDRLIGKDLGWAEGYVQGLFEIVLKLQFRSGNGKHLACILARLYAEGVPIMGNRELANGMGKVGQRGEGMHYDDTQGAVFVGPVNLIQVKNRRIRSLCVIHLRNEEVTKAAESGFYESVIDGAFEVLNVFTGVPPDAAGVVAEFVVPVNGRHGMVQTRPKVSDNISGQQGDRNLAFVSDYIKSGTLVIDLFDKPPYAVVGISSERDVQVIDVLRGPVGF